MELKSYTNEALGEYYVLMLEYMSNLLDTIEDIKSKYESCDTKVIEVEKEMKKRNIKIRDVDNG